MNGFYPLPSEEEGILYARYLVGRVPPSGVLQRWAEARILLFDSPPDAADAALLSFVSRHAWSLGPLEAACAWLRPQSEMRRRLLVMAALLEAAPEGADDFLPRQTDLLTVPKLALLGLAAGVRTLAGFLLWPLVGRERS